MVVARKTPEVGEVFIKANVHCNLTVAFHLNATHRSNAEVEKNIFTNLMPLPNLI